MHGLDEYDSEARWYYPAIMRTTTIDPLAEKYYSISPYAWCGNNPVRMVDLDGREPTTATVVVVAGVALTAIDIALIAAGVTVAGVLWTQGEDGRLVLKQEVQAAINDYIYKDNPGYKEQNKREGRSNKEDTEIVKNHNKNNKDNNTDPGLEPGPKRPIDKLGPASIVVIGYVTAFRIFNSYMDAINRLRKETEQQKTEQQKKEEQKKEEQKKEEQKKKNIK